ncbi:MAG: tetratricopeptide repeat protein [Candidatus Zixiibacteriota bacterium]
MYKYILIYMLLLISAMPFPVLAIDAKSVFAESGKNFENMEYDKALEGYQTLVDNGYESASLYFNMGNCYFKQGQLGYAILYYMKAERLNPNDDDIRTNLAFSQQFMPTRLEGVKINPVTDFLDLIVGRFTLDTIAWISSILFILFILILAWKIYMNFSGSVFRIAIYTLLVIFVISSGLTTYKYRTEYLKESGVIIDNEANVYSSPSEDSEVELVGSFGLVMEITKKTDDYYLVIFENKRKGWINIKSVGII